MQKIIIPFLLLILLTVLLIYPSFNRAMMETSLHLWVVVIIPSFIPMYMIASLLNNYPFISKLLYPLLKKPMHFENQKACSLFLLSIICGEPSSTYLINQAISDKAISLKEGNRLMRFSTFLSPLFIINICSLTSFTTPYLPYIIILSQILSSCLIAFFSIKTSYVITNQPKEKQKIDNIIEDAPYLLLNILMIIILTNMLKMPIQLLLKNLQIKSLYLTFLIDSFEITTGLSSIIHYEINELTKIFLMNFLLSFTGLCIIFQVRFQIKKTKLNFTNFLSFRIIHGLASGIISFVIILLIFLF